MVGRLTETKQGYVRLVVPAFAAKPENPCHKARAAAWQLHGSLTIPPVVPIHAVPVTCCHMQGTLNRLIGSLGRHRITLPAYLCPNVCGLDQYGIDGCRKDVKISGLVGHDAPQLVTPQSARQFAWHSSKWYL